MEIITLKNGLRIAFHEIPYVRSCAMNLYIKYGSRNEDSEQSGAAHFIEHMLFKGTSTLTNEQIAEKIDRLGGQFNACTAKEYTCVYCHVISEAVREGLSLLLQIATDPKFDKDDLETERGVIFEEINMYEDSPEDCAMDSLASEIFSGSGLGNNILGTEKSVKSFSAQTLRTTMKNFYVPSKMVLSVCGNFDKSLVLELAEEYLGFGNATAAEEFPKAHFNVGTVLRKKDFEQSQIIIASEALPLGSPDRFAASVYSALAGAASSSRLNIKIREELGLAYSVYTFLAAYSGVGSFILSAASAHKNHIEVIEKSLEVMENIPKTLISAELDRVKDQFKAVNVMGGESVTSMCGSIGREILFTGKCTPPEEIIKNVDSLTLDYVRAVGERIWNKNRLALCIVGKPEKRAEYQSLGFK